MAKYMKICVIIDDSIYMIYDKIMCGSKICKIALISSYENFLWMLSIV
jgi:hypothetical protein